MPESTLATNRSTNVGARATLATLLAVQIIIGWEWLASGITKVASGNFVSGLAANLKMGLDAAPSWYRGFLTGTAIPNARAFAVLIWVGEIFVGLVLMVGAIVWLARWSRLSDRARSWLLGVTMLALLGGMFVALNFHLAAGGNHPWLIPADGFNETIDLDAMLVTMHGADVVFCGYLLVKIRREHRASAVTAEVHRGAIPVAS